MTKQRSGMEDSLKQMKGVAPPLEDATRAHRRRNQIVGRLEARHSQLIEERARHRKWRRYALVSCAAAALPVVVMASQKAPGLFAKLTATDAPSENTIGARVSLVAGRVTVQHRDRTRTVQAGTPAELDDADRVLTHAGARATLSLESGASVRVSEATEVALLEGGRSAHGEQLGLAAGSVEVEVPKLPAGERFEVKTSEATVVVHGTHFFVDARRDARGPWSEVRVTEGRVAVLHGGIETMLGAGDHWSSRPGSTAMAPRGDLPNTPAASPPQSTLAADSSRLAERRDVAGKSVRETGGHADSSASAIPQTPREASSLAAENLLFRTAMEASRSGDHPLALTRLDELITVYPRSPLVQNARVERFRALRRLGRHPEAARDARRYLADYPNGFAQAEARDVALGPPQD